jgi:hypothetical protein
LKSEEKTYPIGFKTFPSQPKHQNTLEMNEKQTELEHFLKGEREKSLANKNCAN